MWLDLFANPGSRCLVLLLWDGRVIQVDVLVTRSPSYSPWRLGALICDMEW